MFWFPFDGSIGVYTRIVFWFFFLAFYLSILFIAHGSAAGEHDFALKSFCIWLPLSFDSEWARWKCAYIPALKPTFIILSQCETWASWTLRYILYKMFKKLVKIMNALEMANILTAKGIFPSKLTVNCLKMAKGNVWLWTIWNKRFTQTKYLGNVRLTYFIARTCF